ncbi:hypothetical protein SAMN04487760_101149 [Lachnospiraceae bacterium G41]|nr:hypothetical protein SAMN04487760_101149 [Lachnospiraceae bacterium G41]
MIKTFYEKKHKGIAMVTVMITIMFLSIIATTMLYISSTNYAMKTANVNGKKNFYQTDAALVEVVTGIRNEAMSGGDPVTHIKELTTDSTLPLDKDNPGNYNITTIVNKINGTSLSGTATKCVDGDYTYQSLNNQIVVTGPTNNVTTYTFKDIEVIHTNSEGFTNSVKTDLKIDIFEKTSAGGSAGGVGSMSMLLDAKLSTSEAQFKMMTLQGNSFIADFSNGATGVGKDKDGNEYGTFVKPGTEALHLSSQSRINLVGSNNVIYGDMVLEGGSCVAVYGKLTVFGDIKVTDSSNLVLADGSELYMLNHDTYLPGRNTFCSINTNGNPNGIYPASYTVNYVTKENFISFAESVNANDPSNYGLINKIFKPCFPGNKRICDLPNVNTGSITFNTVANTYQGGLSVDSDGNDGVAYEMNSSIYNFDKFGLRIIPGNPWDTNKHRVNGGSDFTNKLIIYVGGRDIELTQSTPNTTWISKTNVCGHIQHGVTLSNIGTDQFNYITAGKGDDESAAYDNDYNPFNHVSMTLGSYQINGKFGKIFEKDCNSYVDNMFTYSGGGGGNSSKTYSSALSMSDYSRDFDFEN